jgi:hypothetical protein
MAITILTTAQLPIAHIIGAEVAPDGGAII